MQESKNTVIVDGAEIPYEKWLHRCEVEQHFRDGGTIMATSIKAGHRVYVNGEKFSHYDLDWNSYNYYIVKNEPELEPKPVITTEVEEAQNGVNYAEILTKSISAVIDITERYKMLKKAKKDYRRALFFANEATEWQHLMLQFEGLHLHGTMEDYFRYQFDDASYARVAKPMMHMAGVKDVITELRECIEFFDKEISKIEEYGE